MLNQVHKELSVLLKILFEISSPFFSWSLKQFASLVLYQKGHSKRWHQLVLRFLCSSFYCQFILIIFCAIYSKKKNEFISLMMMLNAVVYVTVLVFFYTRIWRSERISRIKTAFFTGSHQNFQIYPFSFLLSLSCLLSPTGQLVLHCLCFFQASLLQKDNGKDRVGC